MLYIAYEETGLFPSNKMIDDYYPDIYNQASEVALAGLSLHFIYTPMAFTHVSSVTNISNFKTLNYLQIVVITIDSGIQQK